MVRIDTVTLAVKAVSFESSATMRHEMKVTVLTRRICVKKGKPVMQPIMWVFFVERSGFIPKQCSTSRL